MTVLSSPTKLINNSPRKVTPLFEIYRLVSVPGNLSLEVRLNGEKKVLKSEYMHSIHTKEAEHCIALLHSINPATTKQMCVYNMYSPSIYKQKGFVQNAIFQCAINKTA